VVKENPGRLKRGHRGTIYQSIEVLSKEKGIDPQIVIDAVKSHLVAARKHFQTLEDMVRFQDQTGRVEILASRKWSTRCLIREGSLCRTRGRMILR